MMTVRGACSLLAPLVMLLAGIQTAFADATVVYKMKSRDGSGMQTILYVDKQHVRVDMNSGSVDRVMTMMKLGDKVYAITGKTVQDMSQLAAMMGAMGKGGSNHSKHAPIEYKDTGKTETIAGIKGKVYSFVERGKQHEVVLGENNDLQAAVLGVVEISKSMVGANNMLSMTGDQVQQDVSLKNMAMLRLDDVVHLESITTDSIPDSVFELPSKPQSFGAGMGGMFGK
jgi:hypothetical protein